MPFADFTLNDGHKIPAIAYGTGSVLKGTDVTEYVEQALETGFSHIDTAQYYETEESTGRALKESGLDRSEIYVTSKYSGIGEVHQAVKESLDKLGLKYLDLYLIHFPEATKGDLEGAWKEFEKIKKEGLAKSIGVSNFNLEQLQTLIKTANIKPAVNQILFHPYNHAENKALLEYAVANNIVIEAYSSLTPITKLPGGPVDKVVKEAATKRGVQPSQILLAWVRAKGVGIVTTSTKKQHLLEYLQVADIEPLTSEEIAAIDEAGAQKAWTTKITDYTVVVCILGFVLGLGVMRLLLGLLGSSILGSRSSY